MFQLTAPYSPWWDQPAAIAKIIESFEQWQKAVTLLGATGTGKTFTMANVIQHFQKPTLIISHNKTLAAQLATEFKHFFPNNAVHYFVSYFDYYQPESYLADKDVYIEKEATINQEIEMYRLWTLASLLTRSDVIVVASVSALYGLWQKEFFQKHSIFFEVGKQYDFKELKKRLLTMQYQPVQSKIEQGMFDFKGDMVDIYLSTENILYRCFFSDDTLEMIQQKDPISFQDIWTVTNCTIRPSSQYLQDMSELEQILKDIEAEMLVESDVFEREGKLVEAQRLRKRVSYDLRMIKETGFVNGIENYSIYFDKREPGESPYTIFDYFPDDMMMIFDESHLSVPQMRAMPQADASRKESLVTHGFRLPTAREHRPLWRKELESKLGRKNHQDIQVIHKSDTKTLFVSATPAPYELELSADHLAEQIIRPTWLLDPITTIYPKSGDYTMLLESVSKLLAKKPHLLQYMDTFDKHIEFQEIFHKNVEEKEV